MPDDKPKPAIPVWQRAPPPPPTQDDPVSSQPEPEAKEIVPEQSPSSTDAPYDSAQQGSASEVTPAVPENTPAPTFATADFETFQQQHQHSHQEPTQQSAPPQSSPPPSLLLSQQHQQQVQRPAAPPIITYPEFLVDAHKPPPLVTPTTVVNSLYIAGGVAAALYGASKFLITPMVESLTGARHEFMTHSQSKVDEFNERLSKIVSRVPESKRGTKGGASNADTDEADSETSDPTELYHRDMGTQTSPPSSRPSTPSVAPDRDVDGSQLQSLTSLREQLDQLAKGSESAGDRYKERQQGVSDLKHYLDTLLYASAGINVWAGNEDSHTPQAEDAVEELKKEIRGVKGVLLSAKRFPALGRTAQSAS